MADWITVATYSYQAEAYIAQGRLRSEGIPAEIANATISTVYPMTDTWTPLELQVPVHLAPRARAILGLKAE